MYLRESELSSTGLLPKSLQTELGNSIPIFHVGAGVQTLEPSPLPPDIFVSRKRKSGARADVEHWDSDMGHRHLNQLFNH